VTPVGCFDIVEARRNGVNLVRKAFGSHQGRDIDLYTFSNDNGLVVSVTNFGGIVTAIRVPDRRGVPGNIVFGYDGFTDYRDDQIYVGALIGRCANRIGQARFQIDGRIFPVSANQGKHHLHGGHEGFSKKVWEAEPVREARGCGLRLLLTSPDGDEGYPGIVDVRVLYLITPDNSLVVEYTAASDRSTVVNLTQYNYFNLAGTGTIDDHHLQINASGYIPVDPDRVPIGTLKPVAGTDLDFRSPRLLGRAIEEIRQDQLIDGGLDHFFVLDGSGNAEAVAAILSHQGSGRSLTIRTSQPGLHFCTGNQLGEQMVGKGGRALCRRGALCLLPQHFPDSPNHRAFPSVILPAGRRYQQITSYHFGICPA
jgi:aldose 1-epimerase